ncbi:hypothetical protein [Pseudomonas pseudonitroreducens]|uniref:hypothetical protein n=1 Tax=Pseudomonas pseudonitroreducens TaxID=2892326 RepID=UPI001F3BFD05|nr:hypothetical protein [Pseudomonas pseudonitroreducens]
MPRALVLKKIPSAILTELLERKTDRPGLTLDDHVEWLAEQGYKASRSAVHRHFASLSQQKQIDEQDVATQTEWMVRLECLMIAAKYSAPGDKDDLLKTAAELVDWVMEA